MNLFVSWSGSPSKAIAEALHNFFQELPIKWDVFISSGDVENGKRWNNEIQTALGESLTGVFCITPSSMNAPWLLYEAGAIGNLDNSKVIPILFGLKPTDLAGGPLATYQALEFSKPGLLRLLNELNASTEPPVKAVILEKVFERAWPSLEDALAHAIASADVPTVDPQRPVRELMEETLRIVRSLRDDRDRGDSRENIPLGPVWDIFLRSNFRRASAASNLLGGIVEIDAAIADINAALVVVNDFVGWPDYVGIFGQGKSAVEMLTRLKREAEKRNFAS